MKAWLPKYIINVGINSSSMFADGTRSMEVNPLVRLLQSRTRPCSRNEYCWILLNAVERELQAHSIEEKYQINRGGSMYEYHTVLSESMLAKRCSLIFLRRQQQNTEPLDMASPAIMYNNRLVFGNYKFNLHLRKSEEIFYRNGMSQRNISTFGHKTSTLKTDSVTTIIKNIKASMKRKGAILRLYEHRVGGQKMCKSSLLETAAKTASSSNAETADTLMDVLGFLS